MQMSNDYLSIIINFSYEIALVSSVVVPADGNLCSILFGAATLATFGGGAFC